jgi:hypothetical protein
MENQEAGSLVKYGVQRFHRIRVDGAVHIGGCTFRPLFENCADDATSSAATSSRIAGATSDAKISMEVASTATRMIPLTPYSSVSPARSSAHCRRGPLRKDLPKGENWPEIFNKRRTADGSRPTDAALGR